MCMFLCVCEHLSDILPKTLHFAENRIGINGHVLMQMEPFTDGYLFRLGKK